jgi:hypothetical protein
MQNRKSGYFEINRRDQRIRWLTGSIESTLLMDFWRDPQIKAQFGAIQDQIENGDLYSGRAARALLETFRNRR